ncbi:hypothetical protein ACOT81_29785 [Streptomyces sp. WI04-05B]|uniref:hypothetical protein n=1 Tax=Streptomyces echiniscabiei TaxID=3028708 RepID=UPI003B9B57E5
MNRPAALPVAVLRVTRAVAGRRALRVAVLVGGLFAFGFLCGERAHAAEGMPSIPGAVIAPPASPPTSPLSPAAHSVPVCPEPGTAPRTAGAEARDRYRDLPVLPA